MQIDGKLILVAGASSGIGAATARALAKEGGGLFCWLARKVAWRPHL